MIFWFISLADSLAFLTKILTKRKVFPGKKCWTASCKNSWNLQKHQEHVRSVLNKLWEFDIQANMDKCKFHVTKTKFLRLIISKDGIKIDLAKIEAIKSWSSLKRVKDVHSFVEFFNFYWHFI